MAKIGSEGDLQWARQFGGDASDQANGISVGEDGHCVVTGYFEGEARFGPEGGTLISAGERDLFVCRLDSEGAIEWVRSAGGLGITTGSAIATDRYGHCLVTGYHDRTAVFGDTTYVNAGYYDLFVAKYTARGQLLWAKVAGTDFGINGTGIATDARGHAYVVGSFIGPVELGSTGFENGALADIFVAKFDGDGNVAWAKQAGGEAESTGFGVAVQPDGTCFVAGAMRGQANFGTATLVSGDQSDMVLAKLPADGSIPKPPLAIRPMPGGALEVRIAGDIEGLYGLEVSDDLQRWDTLVLPEESTDDDPEESVTHMETPSKRAGAHRYFRAAVKS